MQHSSFEFVCTALSCFNMVINRNEQKVVINRNEQKVIKLKQNWVIVNEGITNVKNIIEGLPESEFTSLDYMMLYGTIYNMACEKLPYECSQQLYERYREAYDEYITSKVLPALRKKHDEIMLKELVRRWENHKLMVRYLSQSFGYLDRYFICRSNLPTLKDVGFRSFCDLVYPLLTGSIQSNKNGNLTEVVDYEDGAMKEAVISMIDREREGEQVDRGLARNALDIVAEIGVGKMDFYQDYFEPFVLEHTRVYYSRKASKWISEDRIHDYMLKVEVCLKREKDIVSHYLHFSSEQEILEIVQRELLSVNATKLLEKDGLALFRNDKVDDLSRMYRLFSKIPGGLDHVSSTFKQHVTAEGIALVKQAEDAASIKKVFVGKVIELYDKYLSYVEDYFMNHPLFRKAFNEACETICNKDVAGSSSAELLATFCNDTLRKGGSERLSDDAIEETLEKVVKVLSYNNEKDLFAEFYRRKLGRRLLLTVNADSELEKSFLKKLKRQFGVQFTSKMEWMSTDLTSAREKQSFFEQYLSLSSNPRISLGLDFSVTVLTGHLWRSCKPCDLILPKEMVECVQVFEDFYKTQTENRKLSWIYSLGTCNINGKFKAKTVELIVTTYQASVLLLFNSSDRLSYQEIMTRLNLSEDDVDRLLHSLSCVKYKILLKQPNTKTISPTDYFEFNSKFTDKRRRIKIPLPPMDEKKKVMADVDQDRRYAIDASIVRIMKWRKELRNQDLVVECVKQMGHLFKSEEKIIKKRIEDLISREFLERDKKVPDLLRYLA